MIEENDNQQENEEIDVEETPKPKYRGGLRALIILFVALAMVVGVSYLPLARWSGGKIKDFNLLSDVLPSWVGSDTSRVGNAPENVDPELADAMKNGIADSIDINNDSILIDIQPARVDGIVQVEDYTLSQRGLHKLREALAAGRLARVAVLGDSYIEGDIFTQDLRAQLQTAHGGSGVGYMNLFTEFPGFRRSVRQGGGGWKARAASKGADTTYMNISEHYFTPTGEAVATYKGTSSLANADMWTVSQFLFIAPKGGTVKIKAEGEWESHTLAASDDVQCLQIKGATKEFAVSSSSSSIIGLGVWLDNEKGISVDCMSSRGYSGISLAKVNPELSRQMAKFVDYDLIVLEFGINAMSSSQKNYSVYTKRMMGVVKHMRECYPNADILIMGVGDRGEKKGSAVHSMPTATYMVDAQREVARRTHSLFWDTREAMGGEDAIVMWASNGWANKDYVHLTHKGGKELATRLVTAINRNLSR